MAATAKFLFETDFARGETPTMTVVEHERRSADAEAVAYRNGFGAGQAQARTEIEQQIANTLGTVGETLERLSRGLYGVEARCWKHSVASALISASGWRATSSGASLRATATATSTASISRRASTP